MRYRERARADMESAPTKRCMPIQAHVLFRAADGYGSSGTPTPTAKGEPMQNFTELYEVERRYEELAHRMSTPDAAANADEYARMMRDYKELTPLIEEYRRYTDLQQQEADAKEMLAAESDPAFAAMVQQELCEIGRNLAQSEENLRLLLIPKDADDEKSVILEIRAGAGGEEAALFAHSLWRMYTMYAARRGWQCETISENPTELGGVKEIVFSVEGPDVYSRLKFESGVHRVQRVPETETQGRIHTSTATVAVMPQAEEVDFALDMKDLRIDTFRSSGAGGQHINKTSSAIRVTHLPTGMVVECQNERSQFQNKDKALEILRSRLLAQKQKEQQDAINANRQGQVGTGDRSEKIRTYNFPQDRCTDHRIGLTVHNLDKIMDGNLDEIIDALAMREQAEKLRQLDTQSDR